MRAIAEAGITSTSVILGTASYLSPEQVMGTETGPRSDVYSAGIMAFELLTGTTPFRGDNALTVAHRRLDQDVPPPSSLIDGVPPQFDAFIACATARNPADRFPDASAMADELDDIADELDLPAFRVPAPKSAAQHSDATVDLRRTPQPAQPPVRESTRQFTYGAGHAPAARQFAGIDIEDFAWARQRARRAMAFWTLAVLILTGLVAAASWAVGTNVPGLLGR